MSTFKLETGTLPHFQAISYTWGDQHDQRQILVNGYLVLVRKNCHYALWQARLHYEDQIWIDSVCISREDPQEKGGQVSIMARIFASATKTVACVGPQTDHSRLLFDLCRESDEPEAATMGTLEPHEADHRAKEWLAIWQSAVLEQTLDRSGTPRGDCNQFLLRRGDDGVGHHAKTPSDLLPFETDLSPKLTYHIEATSMINLIRILNNIGGIGTRGLLTRLWKLECKKRDRVYGILSMVEWPSACAPIVPDYQKDAVQLALDFMDYIIASDGTLRHMSALLRALGITGSMLPLVNASSKPCEWYCYGFERAYRVSKDSFGDLNIRFQATRSRVRPSRSLPLDSQSHHVRTVLFASTRIEAAVISEYVREGDIILVSSPYAICVRPLSDSTEFEWLGPALISDHLLRASSTGDRAPFHGEGKGTRLEDLHFRFQLTKEEILMLATDDNEHFGRLVSGGLPSIGRKVQVGHRSHSILHSDQDWSVHVTQLADQ